MNGEISL